MDVCLLWVSCVVRYMSLSRSDHSSRGVLPTVVRRCVWSRNLVNEEVLVYWGLLHQIKKYLIALCSGHYLEFKPQLSMKCKYSRMPVLFAGPKTLRAFRVSSCLSFVPARRWGIISFISEIRVFLCSFKFRFFLTTML